MNRIIVKIINYAKWLGADQVSINGSEVIFWQNKTAREKIFLRGEGVSLANFSDIPNNLSDSREVTFSQSGRVTIITINKPSAKQNQEFLTAKIQEKILTKRNKIILICGYNEAEKNTILEEVAHIYSQNNLSAWAILRQQQKHWSSNIAQTVPRHQTAHDFYRSFLACADSSLDVLILDDTPLPQITRDIFTVFKNDKVIANFEAQTATDAILNLLSINIQPWMIDNARPLIIAPKKQIKNTQNQQPVCAFEWSPDISFAIRHPRRTRTMIEEAVKNF